jgi:hypothetical protein
VWKEYTSPDGRKYYYNPASKESKWVMPEELKKAREAAGEASCLPPACAAAVSASLLQEGGGTGTSRHRAANLRQLRCVVSRRGPVPMGSGSGLMCFTRLVGGRTLGGGAGDA